MNADVSATSPVTHRYTSPTVLAYACLSIRSGEASRCWSLWSDGHSSYSDTTYRVHANGWMMSDLGCSVKVIHVPLDLHWRHTPTGFEGASDYAVHHESAQEATTRILALPESERTVALQLACRDVYVGELLISHSRASAYLHMVVRAIDLGALDARLTLDPLPSPPPITRTFDVPSFGV